MTNMIELFIGSKIIKLLIKYYPVYLSGLWGTLWISAVTVLLGTLLGMVIAMMRMGKFKPSRIFADVYIEVLRGTPILLQLYLFYFVLPQVLPFLKLSQFVWVSIALCVNSSAYVSEVIRSGIQAVDKGQTEAARSLGLSESQTMMKIILPQMVKRVMPSVTNLMTSYAIVKGVTYLTLEPMTIVAIIYLCMTFPLSKIVEKFEKKMASPNSYKKRKRKLMNGGKF